MASTHDISRDNLVLGGFAACRTAGRDAVNLEGGMLAWSGARLPVTRS